MNNFMFIPNEKYFQKIRQKTIGASDIPIICGLSKYKTPYVLWQEKTGRIEPFRGNDITEWGNLHEPNIIYRYIKEKENNNIAYSFLFDYICHQNSRQDDYQPPTQFYPFTEFFHSEVKWAMAHPDCYNIKDNYIIEIKSHKSYVYDYNEVPITEYLQIQWQLLCCGLDDAVLRALVNTNEEFTLSIKSNKKIQEKLIDIASRFMFCINKDKEPMPINTADIKQVFPEVKNKTSYLTDIESEYANKMKERKRFLSDKIKKYNAEIVDINDGLLLLIRDNKYLYDTNGEKVCSQVIYEKESLSIKDLPENIYTELKNNGIIKINQVRYVR